MVFVSAWLVCELHTGLCPLRLGRGFLLHAGLCPLLLGHGFSADFLLYGNFGDLSFCLQLRLRDGAQGSTSRTSQLGLAGTFNSGGGGGDKRLQKLRGTAPVLRAEHQLRTRGTSASCADEVTSGSDLGRTSVQLQPLRSDLRVASARFCATSEGVGLFESPLLRR